MKTIFYFTAGITPTVAELAEIAVLNARTNPGYAVHVKNGAVAPNSTLENPDYVAGTIPTDYNEKTHFGYIGTARPLKLKVLPATASIAALGTKQLSVLSVTGHDSSDLDVADVTASCTFSSATPAKATVDANGLITGVAAGTSVITATYEFSTGKTITATMTITVTA